ncbi:helix-turn-helix domain-containing protein [Paenibacillus sp. 1P07SE]|uniref:helix-turn-helix domain-containing protein n=1 Tax=Paenibacillus sp. 1P07SE TaxID=3132209 RepID=UPI0039A699ED
MKIVLVDDEKGIVEGLKYIINRYLPECTVAGVAYNGVEGASVIRRVKPELVITDIRMPQSDGLDMIKGLKEQCCPAKFILLSGFAEFEYARRGLNLGALSYINKPVEEEELQTAVQQAMKVIREEKEKQREVEDLQQKYHNRIQERALREVLDLDSTNAELMQELLGTAQIRTENTWLLSMILEFSNSGGAIKEDSLEQLYAQVDGTLGDYREVYRFRYSGTQIAVVVTSGTPIGYAELIRSVHKLKENVYRQLERTMTVGVGTIQREAAGISRSFEEARYALSYQVVKGTNTIIAYPEISQPSSKSQPVSEELISRLEAALDNMDGQACSATIREIFGRLGSEPDMSLGDLQRHCLNILLSSVRKMSFQQLQQNDFLGRHLLSLDEMSRFQTLAQLEDWMIQAIRRILQFKEEHHVPKKKDIIAEVKEYVNAHYNEQITLAELSARFFISPYYLSQFFKQKTGETYVNYLTRIRINKAQELLEKTDLKVYEICQLVGYSDGQHFARMFEKLTGCKPRDYRKNLPNA